VRTHHVRSFLVHALPGALVASMLLLPGEAQAASSTNRVIRDPRITESSGMALSTRFKDVVYTHNDAGDAARVFAVGPKGYTRAVLTLKGVRAIDWEDISKGPRRSLWIGDIGDYGHTRSEIAVYRIREPQRLRTQNVAWSRIRLSYPDGAHDAESLMVNPRTGRIFVATKAPSHGTLYRAPLELRPGKVNRLQRVGTTPAYTSGGEFGPKGRRLVLRNYQDAFVYQRVGGTARKVDLPSQPQGESVTFTRTGRALLVGSEGKYSSILRVPL
jgi:hypothetical protein